MRYLAPAPGTFARRARRVSLLTLIACLGFGAVWPLPPQLLAQAESADSIYALAIAPSDYAGHDYVFLLDEGVVRVEPGGRNSYTFRQVGQILTKDGAADWGEIAFSYVPERQRFQLGRLRVIGPDGRVLSDGPKHVQESSPSVDLGSPVYSDRRVVRATLAGVTVGAIVDVSYTVQTLVPRLEGDFRYRWAVNTLEPIRRSRFVLDTPLATSIRVRENNLNFTARESIDDQRRVRTWATTDLAAVELEQFAGFPNDVFMSIDIAGSLGWAEIGTWYLELLGEAYDLTPEIERHHDDQLVAAATLDDSLRATYRWVVQEFRYVSLALGEGGYRPRTPREVVESRFGDCKDKAILFVALARRMGLAAYPVLVRATGGVDRTMPSLSQFDHMIAVVHRSGGLEYADLTVPLAPYGALSETLQGGLGLELHEDLGARLVPLPVDPPESNRLEVDVVGKVKRDGQFVGALTVAASGTEQYELREAFAAPGQQDDREELVREYAQLVFTTAKPDSSQVFDGSDLSAPARITVWFSAANVISQIGSQFVLPLPLNDFTSPSTITDLEAAGPRRFPIDVAQLNSPSVHRWALDIELPEGWRVELPPAVRAGGAFGYYRGEYRQQGRRLLASREMGGHRGLVPADSGEALIRWLRDVSLDAAEFVAVDLGSHSGLVASVDQDSIGPMAEVLIGLSDLPDGAVLAAESISDAEGLLVDFGPPPVQSLTRVFSASEVVFTAGSSKLVLLNMNGVEYRTHEEALKPIGMLGLIDLPAFFEQFASELIGSQVSIRGARPIDVPGVGDGAAGWMMEFVSPLTTLDLGMLFLARGRVAVMMMALGPQGTDVDDLVALVQLVDDRVKGRPSLLADMDPRSRAPAASTGSPTESRVHDIALDSLLPGPNDFPGTLSTDQFQIVDGVPQLERELTGRGFTFPASGSPAVGLVMTAMLFDTEAHALKWLLTFDEEHSPGRVREVVAGGDGWLIDFMTGGEGFSMDLLPSPGIGFQSRQAVLRWRGPFKADMDLVAFVRGRVAGIVLAMREPGASDAASAATVAGLIDERIEQAVPDSMRLRPSRHVVQTVERVAAIEREVNDLIDARDFERVFRTIAGAKLGRAPVSFEASTWNGVCWWASVYGHAAQAMSACEAAVTVDTTNLARRDSRAVARGLAGDIDGAIHDFAYVVERAEPGPFLDSRAQWLEALRRGESPFTESVLAELRSK